MFSIFRLIKHDFIPGFQMHLYGAHLLGDVLARPLYDAFSEVGGELRPASVEMLMLEPSDEPMLAAISLTALTSNEFGMKMPSCPSLSNTESSTGIIDPRYSSEVISTPSRSPCTRAAPTTRVLRGTRTRPHPSLPAAAGGRFARRLRSGCRVRTRRWCSFQRLPCFRLPY